jgi:hypothetical protein
MGPDPRVDRVPKGVRGFFSPEGRVSWRRPEVIA